VRKQHAELSPKLALKCQEEYQVRIASKQLHLLYKLRATINTITNITTNTDKMMLLLQKVQQEPPHQKRMIWKVKVPFQYVLDQQVESQESIAQNQNQQRRRALLRNIVITFKLVEMTKMKNSNIQDQTVSISQSSPSALE
jgi:hypothetical protein